jgi:CheY-like chemotaxis protein
MAMTTEGLPPDRLCVLLVDDVLDNLDVYAQYLEAQGHCIHTAVSAADAIRIATTERPDVVVMDLGLPGVDGWQATRILRDHPDTQHIPVLALSAHVYAADRQRAMEAGTVGFVPKPCLPAQLLQEILRVALKARPARPAR